MLPSLLIDISLLKSQVGIVTEHHVAVVLYPFMVADVSVDVLIRVVCTVIYFLDRKLWLGNVK